MVTPAVSPDPSDHEDVEVEETPIADDEVKTPTPVVSRDPSPTPPEVEITPPPPPVPAVVPDNCLTQESQPTPTPVIVLCNVYASCRY